MKFLINPSKKFIHRFFCKTCTELIGMLLPYASGTNAGFFTCQIVLFKKNNVFDSLFSQEISQGTTGNTPTDNRVLRYIAHRSPSRLLGRGCMTSLCFGIFSLEWLGSLSPASWFSTRPPGNPSFEDHSYRTATPPLTI